ncbi:ABC transporter permease [Hoylesella marshii]|uniref:ABC transporter permease n=1 Tax=Hoylesella marshii TaxID=189722 RepID=UPI0028D29010|nr:ABC transporter permease [Hoylesella marshii]
MDKDGLLYKIKEGIHDMGYIWMQEIRLTVKDEGVLIFFILVPFLYPLLYSWIYNNESLIEVPVSVVDLSHSKASREFIQRYDASPDVQVVAYCNSLDEARTLVGKQTVRGILLFPTDFSMQLHRMEQTTVSVYCDMSLMLTYKAIYQSATSVAQRTNRDIQITLSGNYTDRDDEVNTQPLAFEEVPIFNTTGGYGNFIIPAVLLLILQQTLLLGIGLSAGTSREHNRFRDLVPMVKHYKGIFRIVFGKSLCYFMIYTVISAYLTLVVPRIFGFVSMTQSADLTAFMLPYLLACIFFGMIISCLVRYRENIMLLVVFTSVPLLFLSGISWPQSSISGAWQGVSWIFPSTFGIRGFVRMNSMGATLNDIQPEYIALWIQAVVYLIVVCLLYRYQILRSRRHVLARLKQVKEKRANLTATNAS